MAAVSQPRTNDNYYCLQVKARKASARRVIKRMLHTQLAGAFDCFSEAVAQLAEHRKVVLKTVARWRQPLLRVFFDGWCDGVAVVVQEMIEEASHLAQQRLSTGVCVCACVFCFCANN